MRSQYQSRRLRVAVSLLCTLPVVWGGVFLAAPALAQGAATQTAIHDVIRTADLPFSNVSGRTSLTVAPNSCVRLRAVFNGNVAAPGNYWMPQ